MEQKDRLQALLAPTNTTLNGIDFVEIASADQTSLRVHFLNKVPVQGTVSQVQITGGETIPTVAVNPINHVTDWGADAEGRPLLKLSVGAPGDFSFYTLTLTSSALDRFYNHTTFSFKALCPSDLDCAPPPPVCPPEPGNAPPIDYLAKDFLSFRKALSDFSALRYPEWQERSEADFGVMFLEALSSLADDLSYTQDRVAAEATLDTATQRRSIVRHARLVDYEPRPATIAAVVVQFDVQGGPLPAGLLVSAQGPDGASIDFEIGTGLRDQTAYKVDSRWNRGIQPYYWDDSQRCLRAGTTEMWVTGHGFNFTPGQALLLDTAAATSADPPTREVIHLTATSEEFDPLFPGPPAMPTQVTHLYWAAAEALSSDHDLTRTTLAGNLIPATQGRRYTEFFAIDTPPPVAPQTQLALVRTGPNAGPDNPAYQYMYSLRNQPLAWLGQEDPGAPPQPEMILSEPQASPPVEWIWRHWLLDAERFELAFTLDCARFSRIAHTSDGALLYDYDGDEGDTLRFGDGIFGEIPDPGTFFQVMYRVGNGAAGNVAADAITKVDGEAAPLVIRVTNPFPAAGGADEESNEHVRRMAPQAFRAKQFRAVRQEDYVAAAETLPWVLRAGTVFRWTGSWLTVFTTADPKGTEAQPFSEQTQLINLLNRYRMAGYESYVPAPRYVSLDLIIDVCARPEVFRGDVEAAVLSALSTATFANGTTGFFSFDRFTFGMPLERSALEAAIQNAYGVSGVLSIQYRRRGYTAAYVGLPETVEIGVDQILRVDNDPSRPEAGSLRVHVEGGK
ncbi:MAG TPA: baseplate J/gp47 family protein [Ktedonobacterales bacterium]|nr:baseplate J/gp47 family protein [Ktedonobacterales bacterium]